MGLTGVRDALERACCAAAACGACGNELFGDVGADSMVGGGRQTRRVYGDENLDGLRTGAPCNA